MSRKPDYKVAAMRKQPPELKGNVGAAWLNSDGTISVVLDNFVTLQQDGDLLVTLFPKTTNTVAPLPAEARAPQ